jgi:hypothetical protein
MAYAACGQQHCKTDMGRLPFPQAFITGTLDRTQQVLDHAALPGLDLGRDVHAGRQADHLSIDIDMARVQGQGGRKYGATLARSG